MRRRGGRLRGRRAGNSGLTLHVRQLRVGGEILPRHGVRDVVRVVVGADHRLDLVRFDAGPSRDRIAGRGRDLVPNVDVATLDLLLDAEQASVALGRHFQAGVAFEVIGQLEVRHARAHGAFRLRAGKVAVELLQELRVADVVLLIHAEQAGAAVDRAFQARQLVLAEARGAAGLLNALQGALHRVDRTQSILRRRHSTDEGRMVRAERFGY